MSVIPSGRKSARGILVERLAADLLDNAPGPVDAGAIDPLRARLEEERTGRVVLAGARLEITNDGAGEAVAEAGRVGQEVPNGERLCHRPHGVGAGRLVERVEDLQVRQLGQVLVRRIVEGEAVLLDELHRGHRRDRLGHRRDPEDRVGRERPPGGRVRGAEGALISDPAAGHRHRDHARHVAMRDRGRQAGIIGAASRGGTGDAARDRAELRVAAPTSTATTTSAARRAMHT